MHYETAARQLQASRLLIQHYNATKKNILGHGLKLCRRAKAFNSDNPDTAYIEIKENKNGKRVAVMVDVAHCGNAHLCAYCSGVKAAHMRDWITEVFLPAIQRHGLSIGLLTLTAHHRRDTDWCKQVDNFYLALGEFRSSIKHYLKALGSLGRIRTMESPVGSNGLHLHVHDLFTYTPGTDIDAFEQVVLTKWKLACKKYGLKCNSHGVNLRKNGDFDARYIAKEVAAHDTKTSSKSDLQTLFQLLDKRRLKDTQAGKDWIRAAEAIQGRDKWNVGQLANKLDIPCPSDWKKPTVSSIDEQPKQLIEYPQSHHMVATSPANDRPSFALIERAALNEEAKPGSTKRMVLRLCDETNKCNIVLIKTKNGSQLKYKLAKCSTQAEKDRALAIQHTRCNFAIEDYENNMQNYLYPTVALAQAPVLTQIVIPEITYDLDFA